MIGLRANALRGPHLPRTRIPTRNLRFQSSAPPNGPGKYGTSTARKDASTRLNTNISRDALLGGIIGSTLVLTIGYAWYHFSGAKTVIRTANQAKSYFEQTLQKTKQSTPPPSEAIQWLRETALSYASIIPGAKKYVDTVFDDLDTVHSKHREEVDKIVKEAYDELKQLSNQGFNMSSVASAWDVIQKHLGRITELAKDASGDILNNHPQLRDRFGGEFQRLKSLGENYGPEGKKLVDETWNKIQDALRGGVSFDTFGRIRAIVQEATQKLQEVGDQAWQKGMEQAKPYLDRNPQLKQMIEKNATSLKQGNAIELVQKVKDAFSSGSTGDLEKYIQESVNKANTSGGGGFESYFNMIPGGGSMLSNLSQLQEGAQKHGKEAERLLKEAMEEVGQVLSRKVEEGKKLAERASKDTWK